MKLSQYLIMCLLDDTATKYNAVWASMCSDFSRKSMICAWSKVPTRSGGNCMDQDLTWNWWTLRDSGNVHRYTTITDPNTHPPHINLSRQVWNPKLWQSHVNYRFWSGWVAPRRQKRLGEERLAEALRVAHPGCSSSFTMGPRCVQGNYKLQTGEQTKL